MQLLTKKLVFVVLLLAFHSCWCQNKTVNNNTTTAIRLKSNAHHLINRMFCNAAYFPLSVEKIAAVKSLSRKILLQRLEQ